MIKSRDKGGDTVQALASRVRVPRKSNEWGRGPVLSGPVEGVVGGNLLGRRPGRGGSVCAGWMVDEVQGR